MYMTWTCSFFTGSQNLHTWRGRSRSDRCLLNNQGNKARVNCMLWGWPLCALCSLHVASINLFQAPYCPTVCWHDNTDAVREMLCTSFHALYKCNDLLTATEDQVARRGNSQSSKLHEGSCCFRRYRVCKVGIPRTFCTRFFDAEACSLRPKKVICFINPSVFP